MADQSWKEPQNTILWNPGGDPGLLYLAIFLGFKNVPDKEDRWFRLEVELVR